MSTSCCDPQAPIEVPALSEEQIALMCKALGHPARLRLFKHLAQFGQCYFGSLADILPLAPSTISKHVTILREAGLISGASDEQRMCYCVERERFALLQLALGGI
ncbi:ArsR/SmtB family transcription factor [Massilia glaciei]|uniref:ArsR family transcriptional regulator n=1 Tax=Massilia glaciei TaxID=1524097 RepID=A0A2U2HLU8_9BURK|nr:metalloregulator ArsR/SmtB family transcription factor [Massilia glaciei]PWF48480.1 ArsR family transcriptional regulator [Massilia glaciei]